MENTKYIRVLGLMFGILQIAICSVPETSLAMGSKRAPQPLEVFQGSYTLIESHNNPLRKDGTDGRIPNDRKFIMNPYYYCPESIEIAVRTDANESTLELIDQSENPIIPVRAFTLGEKIEKHRQSQRNIITTEIISSSINLYNGTDLSEQTINQMTVVVQKLRAQENICLAEWECWNDVFEQTFQIGTYAKPGIPFDVVIRVDSNKAMPNYCKYRHIRK